MICIDNNLSRLFFHHIKDLRLGLVENSRS